MIFSQQTDLVYPIPYPFSTTCLSSMQNWDRTGQHHIPYYPPETPLYNNVDTPSTAFSGMQGLTGETV